MSLEKRALTAPPELRADGKSKVAAGYAALFNERTSIGGYFTEAIAPGAFGESLRTGDILALMNHDPGRVIGRSRSGTLRLEEDDRGLRVEIDLPDTTDGRDLAIQLDRGDISGMSFGFRVTHDEWDETGDVPARTIHQLELIEVSAVAFPAYEGTELAMRSLDTARKRQNHHAAAARIAARRADAEARFRRIG